MNWYKFLFSKIQIDSGYEINLIKDIMGVFSLLENKEGVGIFESPLINGEKWIYFTPKAAEIKVFKTIIKHHNGLECDAPPKYWNKNDWTSQNSLVVGENKVIELIK